MTRIVYEDVDDFADAMRGTSGRFVRTARSTSPWWIEHVDLTTSSLQQLHTGGAFAFAGKGSVGTLTFKLPLTDPGMVRVNGHRLELHSFLVLPPDCHFVWASSQTCRWGTITVPVTHAVEALALFSERSYPRAVCWRTSTDLLDNLRRLIEGALLTLSAPHLTTACRCATEHEIIAALAGVLGQSLPTGPTISVGRPPLSRSHVIARALALMATHEGEPVFMDDLCRATQVSERALRYIFNEYFGVSPVRLLKVRQLHEIRAALKRSDPRLISITQIAAQFGVFDLSLLARNYKALFGELPSRTLNTLPAESHDHTPGSWFQYASRIFMERAPARTVC